MLLKYYKNRKIINYILAYMKELCSNIIKKILINYDQKILFNKARINFKK